MFASKLSSPGRRRAAAVAGLTAAGLAVAGATSAAPALAAPAPPVCVNADPFPQADFGALPNPARLGQSIAFDGSCSTAPCPIALAACPPATWSWNFGDGTTGSGAKTSHAYAKAGTYTVTLTATTEYGGSDSVSQQIYVLSV